MLCGCFTTLLIPETKRKTLEELSGETDHAVAGHGYGHEPARPSNGAEGVLEKDRTATPEDSL